MSKRKGSTARVHKQRRIDALAARQANEDHIPNQVHDGLNWVKQNQRRNLFSNWLTNAGGDPDFPDGMPAELIAALDQEEAAERDNNQKPTES